MWRDGTNVSCPIVPARARVRLGAESGSIAAACRSPRRMEVNSLVYGIVGCNNTGLWLSHKARRGEGAGRGWGVDGADDR